MKRRTSPSPSRRRCMEEVPWSDSAPKQFNVKIRTPVALGFFRHPNSLILRESSMGSIPITRSTHGLQSSTEFGRCTLLTLPRLVFPRTTRGVALAALP
jgi:hypothetical protein